MGLKAELKRVGLSKQELADRLGVSYRTVLRLEDDVPDDVQALLDGLLSYPISDDEYREEAIASSMAIEEEVESSEPLVPARHILKRTWRLKGEKVYWQGRWWGRGSEEDFGFSAATLVHILKYIKTHGVNGASATLGFSAEFLREVRGNRICPVIVDEIESRFVGGETVPFKCNPWEVTTELGDCFIPGEYFSKAGDASWGES